MAKKLHLEITPSNWRRMRDFIDTYNENRRRVTPRYKPADIINMALSEYLKMKRT